MNVSPSLPTARMLHRRLPRVCSAIVGSDAAELIAKAEAVVRDNSFIELRLDYLRNPSAAYQKIRHLTASRPEALIVATCRRASNGGRFKGSVASQLSVLMRAADNGCRFADVELETALRLKPAEYKKLRSKTSIILSYHDFRGTKKLDETFRKMLTFDADYYKVVSTATSLYDNVLMMKFLEQQSEKFSVVGLCMGEQGIISRVLAVRAGSMFTFASVGPGEETAPGQVATRVLRDVYRIEQVDAATRLYGVAGDPVSHSLSPQMLNAAFRRENLNAVYLPLHARELNDLMASVRDIPVHGLSVTMPYKESILKHLHNTDPLTTKIGACNTVIRGQDGRLYGFNTDVAGILGPLDQRFPTLQNVRVLVLGAGGAGRAAVFGLKQRNAEVFILNRNTATGQKLARQAKAKSIKRADLKKYQFDVIINATPVGMDGKESPLAEKEISARYLFDLVYTPLETKLVKMARAKGIEIIPGAEMFVHQGARQFEIWTGKPAPVEEMRRVVMTELEQQAAAKASNNHHQPKKK